MLQQDLLSSAVFQHIGSTTAAVGALGTASFGIVDATKSMWGGVSTRGFASISKTMATLIPDKSVAAAVQANTDEPATPPALSLDSILTTLKSNWLNGVGQDDQVAIAKSLVKLRLGPDIVRSLAQLTEVDPVILTAVVGKISSGQPLTQPETDTYARFDLILTTVLSQAYQRGDQQYRNTAKILAGAVSVVLAVAGAAALGLLRTTDPVTGQTLLDNHAAGHFWQAVLIGLLATPLAPIAKDVASAIQAGASAVQSWRS